MKNQTTGSNPGNFALSQPSSDPQLSVISRTDQKTVRALRRPAAASDYFPQDVIELQSYFSDEANAEPIQAVPAAGTNVPLWILGSSTFGASLAAELGLPYAFASHFAPDQLLTALDLYRRSFKPSNQLAKPYAMVGVNVIAADTDAKAKILFTTQQMSFAHLIRGTRGLSQPPIRDIEVYWSPQEKLQASRMLSRSIIGSAATVRDGLTRLMNETGADELMIVSDVYDHAARLKSLSLIASAAS